MKNKFVLAIAAAATIGAASLFAVGDAQPAVSGTTAPAAPQPAAEKSCHADKADKTAAAPSHGCCMASGHAASQADAAAGSCHKK